MNPRTCMRHSQYKTRDFGYRVRDVKSRRGRQTRLVFIYSDKHTRAKIAKTRLHPSPRASGTAHLTQDGGQFLSSASTK
jgi:hypothetical protein